MVLVYTSLLEMRTERWMWAVMTTADLVMQVMTSPQISSRRRPGDTALQLRVPRIEGACEGMTRSGHAEMYMVRCRAAAGSHKPEASAEAASVLELFKADRAVMGTVTQVVAWEPCWHAHIAAGVSEVD